jgi:hypothetical protein
MTYRQAANAILIGMPPILVGGGSYWLSKQVWILVTGEGLLAVVGWISLVWMSVVAGCKLADEIRE